MYVGLGRRNPGPTFYAPCSLIYDGALTPPETKKPRKNNRFLRGFFVHSHTRNQAYVMSHRPSRQNTESSADFKGFKAPKKVAFAP